MQSPIRTERLTAVRRLGLIMPRSVRTTRPTGGAVASASRAAPRKYYSVPAALKRAFFFSNTPYMHVAGAPREGKF